MICDVVASVLRAAAWSKSATSTTQSSADSTVAVSATFSAILLSKSSRLSSNPHGIALNGIPVSSSGTSTLCVCKTIRTSSLISHPRHNKSRLSKRGLIRSVKKPHKIGVRSGSDWDTSERHAVRVLTDGYSTRGPRMALSFSHRPLSTLFLMLAHSWLSTGTKMRKVGDC